MTQGGRTQVLPFDPATLGERPYSMFVATLGFERRARYIAGRQGLISREKVASGFDSRKVLAYSDNRRWFVENGYTVAEVSDQEFPDYCESVLCRVSDQTAPRIAIDVSSVSRLRMASWVTALMRYSGRATIEVDFLYAPAVFSPPPHENVPVVVSKPVSDAFAGWSPDPDRPAAAIFGLGYEHDKAVGTLEFLEPAAVWAFRPHGDDPRYEHELERANFTLWDLVPKERIIVYEVARPYECFMLLESLTAGALEEARPVLIPFGPKIFSLCCLIVASLHYPRICVWRVSSGALEEPFERVASGPIVGLTVRFVPL